MRLVRQVTDFLCPSGRLGARSLVAVAVAIGVLGSVPAHGQAATLRGDLVGSPNPSSAVIVKVNRATGEVQLLAKRVPLVCANSEDFSYTPEPIKAKVNRSGRFEGSVSVSNPHDGYLEFFWASGRLTDPRHARGRLFVFYRPGDAEIACHTFETLAWRATRSN